MDMKVWLLVDQLSQFRVIEQPLDFAFVVAPDDKTVVKKGSPTSMSGHSVPKNPHTARSIESSMPWR